MKDNKENQDKESLKRSTKLEITVPFQWEEKPGAPKKDWKPEPKREREPLPLAPLPIKYVASIPFKWEEKPGTPLRCVAKESNEPTPLENKCLPLPPAYFTKYDPSESDKETSFEHDYDYDYDYDYDDTWMLDFEVPKVEVEEPFSSSPSLLLANRLVSKEEISSAVPLQKQNTLEQLFPLYSPNSGFLDKRCDSEEKVIWYPERRIVTLDEDRKLVGDYCQGNGVIRRTPTLGELIMLSRRRSYHRQAIHMRKRNQPKDNLAKNKANGCFNLGASGGIDKLGKYLLRLSLA